MASYQYVFAEIKVYQENKERKKGKTNKWLAGITVCNG